MEIFLVELYLQYVGHVSDSKQPCDSRLLFSQRDECAQKTMHELKRQKQILAWVFTQRSSCPWVHCDEDHVIHVKHTCGKFYKRFVWKVIIVHSHTQARNTNAVTGHNGLCGLCISTQWKFKHANITMACRVRLWAQAFSRSLLTSRSN